MGRRKKAKVKEASPASDDAARASAQDIVARAQAAVEDLSGQGVDVSVLTERLSVALESLNAKEYRSAEMAAGEIVVLAKAMKEMAALSGGIAAEEETDRATIVDAISSEVSRQVKDITRDIPMEIAKHVREATKRLPMELATQVQENLGSYPTADRVEEMASRRASQATQDLLLSKEFEDKVAKLVAAAVDRLPNLTHSDASTIAKETLADALDKLLASKKFRKEVSEVSQEVAEEALKDRPTKAELTQLADEGRLALEVRLEDRPTKDELNKAIADLAGKEGLEQAISNLLAGDELASKVRTVLEDVPRLTPDDVTGIASGVVSQAIQAALASDEWTERVRSITDEAISRFGETVDQSINSLTEGLLRGTGLDEKVRSIAGDLVAKLQEELGRSVLEEVAPAVSATIASEGFAGRVGELIDEKMKAAVEGAMGEKLGGVESAIEELKAHAPEDALEEARKAARGEVASIVDSDKFLKVVKRAVEISGGAKLDEGRVVEIAREQVLEAAGSGPAPVDEEKVASLTRDEIAKTLGGEEFKKAVGEASGAGMQEKISELVKEVVSEKIGAGLDPAMLENAIKQAAPTAVKEIATSDEFKKMLDDKFRVILKYLKEDLVPKTVEKKLAGS